MTTAQVGRTAIGARMRRTAFVIVAALVILFVGNAVARPGCSLLPVEMPTDPDRVSLGTRAQACAALGRPMPEVRYLPLGLHEAALTVDGPPPVGAATHRFVSVFYTIGTMSNLVELMSQRGDQIPPGNIGEANGSVNGAPAIVTERTFPAQGGSPQFTMVAYLWSPGGLLYSLRVRLNQEITRAMADEMAASVR